MAGLTPLQQEVNHWLTPDAWQDGLYGEAEAPAGTQTSNGAAIMGTMQHSWIKQFFGDQLVPKFDPKQSIIWNEQMLDEATVVNADFDESKHPRDTHGKFAKSDGSAYEYAKDLTGFSGHQLYPIDKVDVSKDTYDKVQDNLKAGNAQGLTNPAVSIKLSVDHAKKTVQVKGGLHKLIDAANKGETHVTATLVDGKNYHANDLVNLKPKGTETEQKYTEPEGNKPTAAFPSEDEVLNGLEHVKGMGGTTGATLVRDKAGNEWVMKKGKSPAHLRNEYLAEELYRAAGVPVPDSKLYDLASGPVKLSKFVDGTILNQLPEFEQKKAYPAIQKHFAADALLANWDAVGMGHDNILVDKQGKPWRVDVGGALEYRAQGKPKGAAFGTKPEELFSMRNSAKNPYAAMVFKPMTYDQIADSVEDLKRHWPAMLSALTKGPAASSVSNMSEMINKLSDRMENMPKVLESMHAGMKARKNKVPEVKPPSGGFDYAALEKQLAAKLVSKAQDKAGHSLVDGESLVKHLKANGYFGVKHLGVTKIHLKKVAFLNPNGVADGVFYKPAASPENNAKQVEHLKMILPAGTKIKKANTSEEGMKVGKKVIYKKHLGVAGTSEGGAYQITGTGKVGASIKETDIAGKIFTLGKDPDATWDKHQHQTWSSTLTDAESSVISKWKGAARPIRKAITKMFQGVPLDDTEKKYAENWMSAMPKMPVYKGVAYRGIHSDHAEKLISDFLSQGVGAEYAEQCPGGYSRKMPLPEFHQGQLCLMTHFNHGGRMFDNIHGFQHTEVELCCPPNSKLIIKAIHQNVKVNGHKLKLLVELEQVTPGDIHPPATYKS